MTQAAKHNFRIARLRYQMMVTQSDMRLLTNAGLNCAHVSERLRRMQAELLALIAQRQAAAGRASMSAA